MVQRPRALPRRLLLARSLAPSLSHCPLSAVPAEKKDSLSLSLCVLSGDKAPSPLHALCSALCSALLSFPTQLGACAFMVAREKGLPVTFVEIGAAVEVTKEGRREGGKEGREEYVPQSRGGGGGLQGTPLSWRGRGGAAFSRPGS